MVFFVAADLQCFAKPLFEDRFDSRRELVFPVAGDSLAEMRINVLLAGLSSTGDPLEATG